MRVQPQRKYVIVHYPTYDDVDQCPDLLTNVPVRWRTNPTVLTALASVTMLSAANVALAGDQKTPAKAPRVAPVFQHGEGRGRFGGRTLATPVFISEDEARQVIDNEARRLGLNFTPLAHRVSSSRPHRADQQRPVAEALDGIDNKRQVAYAFVSLEEGRIANGWTLYDSEPLAQAKRLVEQFKSTPKQQTIGVFYDPMPGTMAIKKNGKVDWNVTVCRREELKQAACETARKQLRAQVRDFVEWLKAQGVI